MPHDLVIKGGTIVDGTGADSFTGDIVIEGDRIVEVGRVGGRGHRTIDADGLTVAPGFVDIHTHLDAQLAWDPIGTSSCWHGITSVVLGNCGVTFAPCRPSDRAYLAELMESVEDIPAASILSGLSWEWETYGEYLGEIDRLPKGINVGGMVGHCAVRHHVMGERGLDDRPAPPEAIGAMTDLVDEAIAAGALGFSTSRTLLHRVPDGRPVPGTWAGTDELYAIADVLGARDRGVFEVAPRFEQPGADYEGTRAEVHWMAEVQRRTGRPVTFGVAQSDLGPDLYKRIYDFVDEEAAAGGLLRPQTTARGIGLLFGLANRTFFAGSPVWRDLQELDLDARVGALEDASRRELLIQEGRNHKPGLDFRGVYVMRGPDVHYDYTEADSLEHHAAVAGEDVVEAFVRISRETRGRALFSFPFLNQKMVAVEEMLSHPQTAIGLADSGAHVGLIMDVGLPTWLLSYWVRDRGRFTVEDGVRRMTSDTATLFGIEDRGVLAPGAFADVNLIEMDALALPLPEYVHDFPNGAGRYVQQGRGYEATLVNGEIFMEHGEHTGSLGGVTLRSGPDERLSVGDPIDRLDVARARADTPGCETVVHLNNAGASLPPRPVLEAVVGHLELEARIGGYEAREHEAAAIAEAGTAIARLVGASTGELAFAESATRAWDQVFYALPFEPGDRILTHRIEYASNYLAMLQVATRTGATIEIVPSTATGEIDVDALSAMLDERVRLVAVTHVPTSGGLVNPVAAVGAALAGTGIPYLLDACQSVGQLPIDVSTIGCDFLTSTGRKFLRGPWGTGFLYVASNWITRLEPDVIDMRSADWTTIDTYELQPDARRFEQWERNWASYLGLGAAARYALTFGLDAIALRNRALAEGLRDRLLALPGVTVHDQGIDRCAIVTFSIAGHDPEAIRAAADERAINIWVTPANTACLDLDPRGIESVVRASVHYFNTDAELDQLCDALPAGR